ncbi:MAG: DUF1259 domain-containing protein [Phycisphaerales bacterium]|nr:DUF1259 domain-containing protein [Phycisphaerales bacterium]
MHAPSILISLVFLTGVAVAQQSGSHVPQSSATTLNFDKDANGKLPAGWKVEGTSQKGPVATWQVVSDPTAPSKPNVLALSKINHDSGSTFNICWTDTLRFRNGSLEVRFKAVSGEEDQGGGLIWRARDKDNYYIARYNPLEENYRVYYVKDGARKQLASEKVMIPASQWHAMKIEHDGNHIECYLDGKKYLDVIDATFAAEGGIGLWTKADAVTSFDDLKVFADLDETTVKAEQSSARAQLDTARIEQITGLKGTLNAQENVFKVSQPRSDVSVSVDGRPLEPFMGLTSWASFMPGVKNAASGGAMVMGDLVLFEDEVNPAMDALFNAGLSVTALHNHFFHAEPSVYFMHIGGEGEAESLARGVRAALDTVKSIRATFSQPSKGGAAASVPTTNGISTDRIKAILGMDGTAKDGMFKVVVGREAKMPCGCTVGKEMGVNTWAAFAGSDERAIVDGDFVTFEGELQTVLKALRQAHINIVAIHNHMEGESPKAIFLHYWGKGKAEDLARGVKATLDAQTAAHTQHDQH